MVNPTATQVSQGNTGVTGNQSALSGGANGVFSLAGGNFWDMIFSLTGQQPSITPAATESTVTLNTKVALETMVPEVTTETETDAALEFFATLDPEASPVVAEDVETAEPVKKLTLQEMALLLQEQDNRQGITLPPEKLQGRIDKLNSLISHLNETLPDTAKNTKAIEFLMTRLQNHVEELQAKLEDVAASGLSPDETPLSLLIALGLTPLQITELTKRISEVEDKLGRELTVEDLVAGVGGIIPVPEQSVVINDTLSSDAEPSDDLAAQLNGLVVGGTAEGEAVPEEALPLDPKALKNMPTPDKSDLIQNPANNSSAKSSGVSASAASFNQLLNAQAEGDVNAPKNWYRLFLDSMSSADFDISTGLPLTSASQAAHAATSIGQAGQTHPATQLIAAHMTKAARDGTTKAMTIELDPPELGRVDVRLEFGPEKTVKAHLLVERVETHNMLQRDSFFLERALQSAGLDVNSGSLSFELAQGGTFDRGNEGQGDGSGNGTTTGQNSESVEDTIQTTMTWQVDQDTGHVRYNILV